MKEGTSRVEEDKGRSEGEKGKLTVGGKEKSKNRRMDLISGFGQIVMCCPSVIVGSFDILSGLSSLLLT